MANWKHTIRIAHIMDNEELSAEEKGSHLAVLLVNEFPAYLDFEDEDTFDPDLSDIVLALDSITGYDGTTPDEELEDVMASLYDWADSEVAPFGMWPPNKMLWIVPR